MKLSQHKYFVPILLFVVSLCLHLYQIQKYPPSLNWDEISHGYNAYSILKTGQDEWGTSLPSIFRAYGDYKLPLYIYLTVPSVALLGLNPLSIRLVSIIAGALIPVFVYLISLHFFSSKSTRSKTKLLAFLAALVTALSPWSIFLSRIALEANLFIFLFIVSIYFLIKSKPALSSLIYAFGLITYNSSRVLLPFYLILLAVHLFRSKYKLKANWFRFLPFLAIIILVSFQTISQSGQARYQWVSLLDQGAINRINQLRQTYPRILVNKVTYFAFTATKNYLAHFNPKFLFLNGGSHYQFNIPNYPLISPLLLPIFIIGLFYLPKYPIIFFLLLITPIPSAITRDAPHTLRSGPFLLTANLVIALGLHQLSKVNPKAIYLFVFIALFTSQISFWPQYRRYATNYSNSWQYGYKQAVNYAKQNYSHYDQIYFSKYYGEPHEFILFYWPWDPASYQDDPSKVWDYHANWYWVDAFDKFKFINDWQIKDQVIPSNSLLITSPGNFPTGGHHLHTINFLDSTPAFDIIAYD